MPVVMENQTQGLQEINRLSKGEVAGVLKEWQANFANISWLKTLNIMRGPQGYYIVLSNNWLSNPFNLYDWLFNKSGERLNPITAMSALSWEDEDLGFKGGSVEDSQEDDDEPQMQSIGVTLNTPVEEPDEVEEPSAGVEASAEAIQMPTMQPVIQQPPTVQMPTIQPVIQQPPVVQMPTVQPNLSNSTYILDKPSTPVDDDEAVTGFFGGADEEEQGSPTYAEMQSPRGITVDVYSGRPIVVGRSKKNSNLHLEYEGVSRVHAKLQYRDGVLYVTDLGSTNGTYVNGSRLESFKDTPVHSGDTVEFYKELFKVV